MWIKITQLFNNYSLKLLLKRSSNLRLLYTTATHRHRGGKTFLQAINVSPGTEQKGRTTISSPIWANQFRLVPRAFWFSIVPNRMGHYPPPSGRCKNSSPAFPQRSSSSTTRHRDESTNWKWAQETKNKVKDSEIYLSEKKITRRSFHEVIVEERVLQNSKVIKYVIRNIRSNLKSKKYMYENKISLIKIFLYLFWKNRSPPE